jgi:hypothetical protein
LGSPNGQIRQADIRFYMEKIQQQHER